MQYSVDTCANLRNETDEKIAKVNKYIASLKADIQVEMNQAKKELGIGDPRMSSKTTLYSISRVVEMILEHLMIKTIYVEQQGHSDINGLQMHIAGLAGDGSQDDCSIQ